jgi:hypothetical protein
MQSLVRDAISNKPKKLKPWLGLKFCVLAAQFRISIHNLKRFFKKPPNQHGCELFQRYISIAILAEQSGDLPKVNHIMPESAVAF